MSFWQWVRLLLALLIGGLVMYGVLLLYVRVVIYFDPLALA